MITTIKDIARQADVSVTTVSHVINGTRHVSEAARGRVQQAVADLNYVPSALARSLKSSRTHTIGMMIPNSSNPYFAEIIRGIEDHCFDAGFNVVLCNSDDDPHKQSIYIRVLCEKQVDGLIVMSSGGDPELLDTLRKVRMPLVVVDREIDDLAADLVEVNHEAGAQMATEHLLALGHRRIACIAGPPGLSSSAQRLTGHREALAAAGVAATPKLIQCGGFTSEGGHAAMTALLKLPSRPTAVFASNDLMALGAICAAAQHGLAVPGDLSIVGFDDIALSGFTNPPLTTVAQPKRETGALAAQLLMDRIASPDRAAQRQILQPSLRVRSSTAPLVAGKKKGAGQ